MNGSVMRGRQSWFLTMGAFIFAGCASPLHGVKLYKGTAGEEFSSPPQGVPGVEVTYLGVGGYVVRRGTDAILFAPSFTNPGIPELIFGSLKPDTRKIDSCMKG